MVKQFSPQEIISQLKVCSWKYNEKKKLGDKIHYGLIAQDVIEQFGPEYNFVDCQEEYLKVNYYEFIGPLIKCVQEQEKRIKKLENIINNIKGDEDERDHL